MNFIEILEESPKDAALASLTAILLKNNFEDQRNMYEQLREYFKANKDNLDAHMSKVFEIFKIEKANNELLLNALMVGEKNTTILLKNKYEQHAPKSTGAKMSPKIKQWWE